MKKLIAGIASAAILSTGCGESPDSTPQACLESYFDQDVAEHIEKTKARLESAIALARSLDIPEAHKMADFLQNDTAYDHVSAEKSEVITLDPDMNYKCSWLDGTADAPAFGHFNDHIGALFFIEKQNQPISEFWGALIGLHEGRHNYNYAHGFGNPFEERDTRVFEQRILLEVGGSRYRSYLDKVKKIIEESDPDAEINPPGKELDEVFGEATSEADDRLRKSIVLIHAAFELIEDEAKVLGVPEDEIKARQQAIFERLYADLGV